MANFLDEGHLEVAVTSFDTWILLAPQEGGWEVSRVGPRYDWSTEQGPRIRALIAADLDWDGRSELGVLEGPSFQAKVLKFLDLTTGAIRASIAIEGIRGDGIVDLVTGDVDGDGRVEVVVLGVAKAGPGDLVEIYDAQTGELERSAPLPSNSGAMVAAELDGDLASELVVGGFAGAVALDGATLSEDWTYPGTCLYSTPGVGDFDGDLLDELLCASGGELVALDPGEPDGELWRRSNPPELQFASYATVDTDGDGIDEIVQVGREAIARRAGNGIELERVDKAAGRSTSTLIGWDGTENLWRFAFNNPVETAPPIPCDGYGLGVGRLGPLSLVWGSDPRLRFVGTAAGRQIDAAGGPDVAYGSYCVGPVNEESAVGFVLEQGDPRFASRVPFDLLSGEATAMMAFGVGQADADPQLELFGVLATTASLPQLYGVDPVSGESLWPPVNLTTGFRMIVAELQGGAEAEVVVIDSSFGNNRLVRAVSSSDGSTLWTRGPTAILTNGVNIPIVGNVDSDPEPELVGLASQGFVVLSGADGAVEHEFPLSDWRSPALLDLDDDGRQEIVADVGGALRSIDPETGEVGRFLYDLSPGRAVRAAPAVDARGAGRRDLALWSWDRIQLIDLLVGEVVWTGPRLGLYGYVESLQVVDLEGDGDQEIVATYEDGFDVFEIPMNLLFADGFELGDTRAWSSRVAD